MATLVMMCGVPGSGKSTKAKELKDTEFFNANIHSSDSIRQELFGDETIQKNPAKVFWLMQQRTITDLLNGIDVIYDATNIKAKDRFQLLGQLPKDTRKIIYIMNIDIGLAKKQNKSRIRVVPDEVIDRMYSGLQTPTEDEGWDEIRYCK